MNRVRRTLIKICVFGLIIDTLLMTQSLANAQPLLESVINQIAAISAEKAARTPAQRKIGSALLTATHPSQSMTASSETVRSAVEVDVRGMTVVDVKAKVTKGLLARIRGAGGTVISSLPEYDSLRASVRVSSLEEIASSPDVHWIRPAEQPIFNKIVSEGDITHRANQARSTWNIAGKGVTVGVLSDSVEALASLQASGDLPPTCPAGPPCVKVLPRKGAKGESEGTAMMEIINSLAPKSNLIFVTGNGGSAVMADNIKALKAAGAKVIVDDVTYFLEPVFQDGVIAQAVNSVVAGGAVYFSSVGNDGNKINGTSGVWEGDMSEPPCPLL